MEANIEFISKGYSRIFVQSEQSKELVHNWYRDNDSFEEPYLHDSHFCIIDDLINADLEKLKNKLSYNGKFEGKITEMLHYFESLNIPVVVMIAYAHEDGDYINKDVEVFATFNQCAILSIPTKNEVIDCVIQSIDIRGINLEDYRYNLERDNLYENLVQLFKEKQA